MNEGVDRSTETGDEDVNEGHPDHTGAPEARKHDSDHAHRGGLLGAVESIFRPHSHDAADSMDSALEASARGIRAVRISFLALLATSVAQMAIVFITGSVALLADTIHNFSDALTAIPLFLAFRLARRPPNRRYTYGYGRAEDLAGIFVILMIATSAVIAGWEAVDRLLHPRELNGVWVLFAAGLLGFVGNELVALFRIREGKAIGSAALVADGCHARTDGFTSLAVSAGAVGTALGFTRADPIVGLVISVAIFAVLRGAARQVYYRLMDAVDPKMVGALEAEALAVPGVTGADAARIRWVGHRLHAEITIGVGGDVSVTQGHEIAATVHDHLRSTVAHLDHVAIHVHPAPQRSSMATPGRTAGSVGQQWDRGSVVASEEHGPGDGGGAESVADVVEGGVERGPSVTVEREGELDRSDVVEVGDGHAEEGDSLALDQGRSRGQQPPHRGQDELGVGRGPWQGVRAGGTGVVAETEAEHGGVADPVGGPQSPGHTVHQGHDHGVEVGGRPR